MTAAPESPGEMEGKQACLDQCLQGQELPSVPLTVSYEGHAEILRKLPSGARLDLGETSS